MNLWTNNGTDFTIPFYYFFDDTYKDIVFNDEFTSVFPDSPDLTDQMKNEIKEHFYYRQIGDETPARFLRNFHQTVRTSAARWARLINSETALRPDDAIYNYDMIEEAHYTTSGESKSSSTGESTSFTSDTPDDSVEDIENYMSAAGKTKNNSGDTSEGTSEGTNVLTRKGNIGVMTAAQIIGGYRTATEWSAWNVIFEELERHFLGVF